MQNYEALYQQNKEYRDYIDGYCRCYGMSAEEAVKHNIPQFVGDIIVQRNADKIEDPIIPVIEPECRSC